MVGVQFNFQCNFSSRIFPAHFALSLFSNVHFQKKTTHLARGVPGRLGGDGPLNTMARSKENLALKIGGGQPAHPDGVAGGRGGRHPQRVLGDSHSPGPSDLIGTGTRNRFEISTWSTVGSSTKEAGGVGGVEPRKTKKGTEKHKTAKKGNTAESRMFCSFKHLGATKMSKLQSGKTYANK